jgi:hypothetical protein
MARSDRTESTAVPQRLDDRANRPQCLCCASGHGDGRIVTLKRQARTVTDVCDTCLLEWDVIDESKS